MAETVDLSLAPERLGRGAAAGLAGGVVFGAMMDMMGTMPAIGGLVGLPDRVAGWGVHLVLSALFGMVFAAGVRPGAPFASILGLAVAWGVVLWVVAGWAVMRTAMGLPLAMDTAALLGLLGHLVYGAVLGLVYGLWGAPMAAPPRAWPR